jgi:hypothetical protein
VKLLHLSSSCPVEDPYTDTLRPSDLASNHRFEGVGWRSDPVVVPSKVDKRTSARRRITAASGYGFMDSLMDQRSFQSSRSDLNGTTS